MNCKSEGRFCLCHLSAAALSLVSFGAADSRQRQQNERPSPTRLLKKGPPLMNVLSPSSIVRSVYYLFFVCGPTNWWRRQRARWRWALASSICGQVIRNQKETWAFCLCLELAGGKKKQEQKKDTPAKSKLDRNAQTIFSFPSWSCFLVVVFVLSCHHRPLFIFLFTYRSMMTKTKQPQDDKTLIRF